MRPLGSRAMDALMGPRDQPFMDAFQDDATGAHCCRCRRERRRSRACWSLAVGLLLLLLLLVTVPLAVALTTALAPCTQRPTQSGSLGHGSLTDAGATQQQQQQQTGEADASEHPRAVLTAPFSGNISIGKRLLWESDMGRAFCEGGLNYSDGYLWVPEEGYYNLMLQITYKHAKETSARPIYHLSYKVWVISGDYKKNVTLITVQDSMSGSVKAWSKSLHVSRLLHLAADSKLTVTSSHTSLIGLNEDETFFGVERSPR